MEFSEAFELNRIVQVRDFLPYSNRLKDLKKLSSGCNSIETSPQFSQNSKSTPDYDGFFSHYHQNESDLLTIEVDNSYLREKVNTRRSSLTVLIQDTSDFLSTSSVNHLVLEIFFFRTENKIKLTVPSEITVGDLLRKALSSFGKANVLDLPNGLDSNGYEIWIAEDDSYLPDTDCLIENNSMVASLGVTTFCICAKAEFTPKDSYKGSFSVRHTVTSDKLLVKFYFERAWTHLAVNPNEKLSQVLQSLIRKFFITGALTEEMFEFRIFLQDTGEECNVDMSLPIRELRTNDIRLYRKKYKDSPM